MGVDNITTNEGLVQGHHPALAEVAAERERSARRDDGAACPGDDGGAGAGDAAAAPVIRLLGPRPGRPVTEPFIRADPATACAPISRPPPLTC